MSHLVYQSYPIKAQSRRRDREDAIATILNSSRLRDLRVNRNLSTVQGSHGHCFVVYKNIVALSDGNVALDDREGWEAFKYLLAQRARRALGVV